MLRHPSTIMSTVAKSNLLNPFVVRTMSSCVATSKTTTAAATPELNLHYGNYMNQSVWHSSGPNHHKNVVHSTTIGNTNYDLPVTDAQTHSKIPSNNNTHRYRTHINSTATNPNGGYVMFTL
jgi:hypothetical protein